jgi:hypothetical protein
LAGAPIGGVKGRGGLALGWVGYGRDCGKFQDGISEPRRRRLVSWAERIHSKEVGLVGGLAEGSGRLGLTAGGLELARPLRSPWYAWTSAAPAGSVLPLPPGIRLLLTLIQQELKEGRRTTNRRAPTAQLGELFRTDAKGEGDCVVLGGWECRPGTPPGRARWFSAALRQADTPWLFARGHGIRAIAAPEMLATLVAALVFVGDGAEATGAFACSGTTDSQGNGFVVHKLYEDLKKLRAAKRLPPPPGGALELRGRQEDQDGLGRLTLASGLEGLGLVGAGFWPRGRWLNGRRLLA